MVCGPDEKHVKIERVKCKERISVWLHSLLCNMPAAVLGNIYEWLVV
jgi:hypothetical protein